MNPDQYFEMMKDVRESCRVIEIFLEDLIRSEVENKIEKYSEIYVSCVLGLTDDQEKKKIKDLYNEALTEELGYERKTNK